MKERARPQDVAAKKLAHARKMVARRTQQMKRTVTSLHQWEAKARHYAKRASLTDAELAAARDRAKAAQAARGSRRRGIALTGTM